MLRLGSDYSKFDERQVSRKKYEEGSTASKEIDDAWAESHEPSGLHISAQEKRMIPI